VKRKSFEGVWVPALTPFNNDLSVNGDAFVRHCAWLLEQGADGLAVFGTTSEASSLSVEERISLLGSLVDAGIPGDRLMPGVGCCALPDTVRLCRHAVDKGCAAVLMLPPFYYKNVDDEGLFRAFSAACGSVSADRLRILLYHIPRVSGVALSPALIERLVRERPGCISGIKDSGGDWSHTRALLERFPDLCVFAGSERYLLDTLRADGAGCITASGNINPAGIRSVAGAVWGDAAGADRLQSAVTAIRDVLERYPMIPALKSVCARHHGNDDWRLVRPPLVELSREETDDLSRRLDNLGFSMQHNREAVSRIAAGL